MQAAGRAAHPEIAKVMRPRIRREIRSLSENERTERQQRKALEVIQEEKGFLDRLLGELSAASAKRQSRANSFDFDTFKDTATTVATLGAAGAAVQRGDIKGVGDIAGIKPEHVGRGAIAVGTILANTAEHPKKVVTDLAKAAPGMVAGAASAAIDPMGTVDAAAKDVEHRYGKYLTGAESHKKFEKRVDKDPMPYALDVAGFGTPVGRVATAGARAFPVGRMYSAARHPRPELRVGSGSQPQPLSKGLIGAPLQRGLDRARRGRTDRLAGRGNQEALQAQAAGAVLPRSSLLQRRAGKQRAAQIEATNRNVFQRRMGKEVPEPTRKLRKAVQAAGTLGLKLDPHREMALDIMVQHGARTAAEVADWAQKRIDFHEQKRKPEEAGDVHEGGPDVLRQLGQVKYLAEKIVDDRLRAAADLAQKQGVRARELNPAFDEGTAIREVEPSMRVLGMGRREGENPAEFETAARELLGEMSSAPPGYMRHGAPGIESGAANFAKGSGQYVPKTQSTTYSAFDVGRYSPTVEALYTLPLQHPIVTSILGRLSELHEDELRRLLHVGPDDPLPWDVLGSIFWIKDGKLQRMPLNRMNPALNTLTGMLEPGTAPSRGVQLFSPLVAELYMQASGQSTFEGKGWQLGGAEGGARIGEHGARGPTLGERGLHAADTFASMAMPYRVWEKTQAQGRSTADISVPWNQRYVRYAEGGKPRRAQKQREREGRAATGGYLDELGRQSAGPLGYPVTGGDPAGTLEGYLNYLAEQERGRKRGPKPKRHRPRPMGSSF